MVKRSMHTAMLRDNYKSGRFRGQDKIKYSVTMSWDPKARKHMEQQVLLGQYEPLLDLWRKGEQGAALALEFAQKAAVRRVSSCIPKGDYHTLTAIAAESALTDAPRKLARQALVPAIRKAIQNYTYFEHWEGLEQISSRTLFPEDIRREAGILAVRGYSQNIAWRRLIAMAVRGTHLEDIRSRARSALDAAIRILAQSDEDPSDYEEWLEQAEEPRLPVEIRERIEKNAEKKARAMLQQGMSGSQVDALLRMSRMPRLFRDIREAAGQHAAQQLCGRGALDELLELAADSQHTEAVRQRARDLLPEAAARAVENAAAARNAGELLRLAALSALAPETREAAGFQANQLLAERMDRGALKRILSSENASPEIRRHAALQLIGIFAEKGEYTPLLALREDDSVPDDCRKTAWEALPRSLEVYLQSQYSAPPLAEILPFAGDPRISQEIRGRLGDALVDCCLKGSDWRNLLQMSQNARLNDPVRIRAGCAAAEILARERDILTLKDLAESPRLPLAVSQAATEAMSQCATTSIFRMFRAEEGHQLQALAQMTGLEESLRVRAGLSAVAIFRLKPVSGYTSLRCLAEDAAMPAMVRQAAEEALREIEAEKESVKASRPSSHRRHR